MMIYLFIIMCYGSVMQGLHGKGDNREILNKAWVELPLEALGTVGD